MTFATASIPASAASARPASRPATASPSIAALAMAALLAGCAGSGPPEPVVDRTRAPIDYENTINNYFAFTLKNPPKNRKVAVAAPQPGGCPVGGRPSSERGWVVPVTYTTYSGTPNGKDIITIVTREYFFWFRQDTIAGVTPKMEICP